MCKTHVCIFMHMTHMLTAFLKEWTHDSLVYQMHPGSRHLRTNWAGLLGKGRPRMTRGPESWSVILCLPLSTTVSRPGGNWACDEERPTLRLSQRQSGLSWVLLRAQGSGAMAAAHRPGSPVNQVGQPRGGCPLPTEINTIHVEMSSADFTKGSRNYL